MNRYISIVFCLVLFNANCVFSQNIQSDIDSLINIVQDTNIADAYPVKIISAIKQIGKIKQSEAVKAAPYLAQYLDMKIDIDTMEYLNLLHAYSSFIPKEELFPTIYSAVHIGEPILPYIIKIILEEKVSLQYKYNALRVIVELKGSSSNAYTYIAEIAKTVDTAQKDVLLKFADLLK